MLDQVDATLRQLFTTQVPGITSAAQVKFQPPDEEWHNYVKTLTVGGNYAKVAEGLNVAATRVEKPSDIVPAIKDAVAVTRSGAPFLLEVVVKEGYDFSRYPLAGL